MIWTPDRPGSRGTGRWLQRLREDDGWPHHDQPGAGPGRQEPAGAPGLDGEGDSGAAGSAGPDSRWVADGDMRWAAEGEPPRGHDRGGWAGEGETRRWVADGDTGWAAGVASPRGADVHGGRWAAGVASPRGADVHGGRWAAGVASPRGADAHGGRWAAGVASPRGADVHGGRWAAGGRSPRGADVHGGRWAAGGRSPRGDDRSGWADERETRRGQAGGHTGWAGEREAGRQVGDGDGGDPLLRPLPPTGRAVIGDQLRIPVVWCQLGPCIERYADPAALGEADARARAIAAGWREDALGRFTCPACQQTSQDFWATQQVVQWDREMAVAMTSLIAAAIPEDAVGAAGAETGVLPAALPVPPPDGAVGTPETAWAGPPGPGRHRRRR